MNRLEPTWTDRLALYRRSAKALNDFYSAWTGAFCSRCLEVTRRHHSGDPRADVDLVEGIFPGCCHAGVSEVFGYEGSGEEDRFPAEMCKAVARARRALPGLGTALTYVVRERGSGLRAQGVACVHLGLGACRLGDLKGPLCLSYLCDPVRGTLAGIAGRDRVGTESDDFCGAKAVLLAVASKPMESAESQVADLEAVLGSVRERLRAWGARNGDDLYGYWAGTAGYPSSNGSRCSLSIR